MGYRIMVIRPTEMTLNNSEWPSKVIPAWPANVCLLLDSISLVNTSRRLHCITTTEASYDSSIRCLLLYRIRDIDEGHLMLFIFRCKWAIFPRVKIYNPHVKSSASRVLPQSLPLPGRTEDKYPDIRWSIHFRAWYDHDVYALMT